MFKDEDHFLFFDGQIQNSCRCRYGTNAAHADHAVVKFQVTNVNTIKSLTHPFTERPEMLQSTERAPHASDSKTEIMLTGHTVSTSPPPSMSYRNENYSTYD